MPSQKYHKISTSGCCDLCSLTVRDQAFTSVLAEKTYGFCCMGCKQVFHMLWEASDVKDPEQFKQTELFQKCRDMGIIPSSEEDLLQKQADASSSLSEKSAEAPPVASAEQALPLNLKISGMWCLACAWVLEEMLKKQSGITDVLCNFSTDRLRCMYHPAKSSPDQIISAINRLGYQAAIPGEAFESRVKTKEFIRFAFSAFLTANVMMLSFALYSGFFTRLSPDAINKISWPIFILSSIVLFYGGSPIYRKAWAGLSAAAFGMETLITIGAFSAYIYSTINLLAGSIHLFFDTACMLITLTLLGKTIERKAISSIQEDLENFFSLKPTKVKLCSEEFPDGRYVSADVLGKGDVFMIEANEIVPADGLIVEGTGSVDESSLTGEARPIQKAAGSRLRSGTRVLRGVYGVKAEGVGEDSILGQMILIMENALQQKTPLEGQADRILRFFVPMILALAIATGLVCLLVGLTVASSLVRTVTVMVIACPCALGIAVPIARVAGISVTGKQGILVRDFSAFEQAESIDTIVFDKTGTLTKGDWELLNIQVVQPFDKKKMLMLAVALEKDSDHFIAEKIVQYVKEKDVPPTPLENVCHHQNGISATYGKDHVKIGSKDFIGQELIRSSAFTETKNNDEALKSEVYMSYDGKLCARFVFGDVLRERAVKTVEKLKNMGYSTSLVSGDDAKITQHIGKLLHIETAAGNMLPQDKALFVQALQKNKKQVAMIGDGINDAPALIQADLAVAVHSGSHLGKEVADMTLMQGNPAQIVDGLNLAKQVNKKIGQNLMFSLFYNTVSIPLAMSGLLTPLIAVCAMLLSSLSVTGNTLLMIRKYK